MERPADQNSAALSGSRGTKAAGRTALVLYGSETGNAQDVAEEVGNMTARLRFETAVLDMNSAQLRDIAKPAIVIFVLSTSGQGEMPQNARSFWKMLLSSALKPGLLRRVKFSSFGLGDSSYARFNVAHRMLHGRLVQLGAKTFCERGEGNEQHPEGHSAGLRMWTVALKQKLLESFPSPWKLQPFADDEFLEPKWKLQAPHIEALGSVPERRPSEKALACPSTALIPVKGTYDADIVKNDRITTQDHFQDVRLLDLRIEEPIAYGPGAVAVVYPKNFPQDTQDFINLMTWQDIADRPITLATSISSQINSPSPLRHLDLSTTLTLRWLLENVLDIMAIPRRSFFATLAYFAGTSTEDEKYQKERLLELANPELIDELWDYTTRPKRTILEVMMDFTSIKIPWQYVLTVLPVMRGRQFSIACGGHLKHTEDGKTRVELLIAIADPPSAIIKWRRRYGVCTRYIASLKQGQRIKIGLQPGYLDVQQKEMEVPVIMIGPGTGVAPMRSMIYQRLTWAEETNIRQPDKRLEGDVLIFGCSSADGDYFFRLEWEKLIRDGALTVLTAFSRDKEQPRQYVQDQIRANAKRIYAALVEQNGKVYICGSSGNMPKGVREALEDVFVRENDGLGKDEARTYLDQMEKKGRYKQETW